MATNRRPSAPRWRESPGDLRVIAESAERAAEENDEEALEATRNHLVRDSLDPYWASRMASR